MYVGQIGTVLILSKCLGMKMIKNALNTVNQMLMFHQLTSITLTHIPPAILSEKYKMY